VGGNLAKDARFRHGGEEAQAAPTVRARQYVDLERSLRVAIDTNVRSSGITTSFNRD
jgi:hypothetical protein